MGGADRPLRVLLVEDEGPNRDLVAAILGSNLGAGLGPIELRQSATLAEARAHVRGWSPDLILLDIRLPDGSGLDLVRDLPGVGQPGRPAVVVMSASVLPQHRAMAQAAGVDAFLGKPYRPTDLTSLLAGLAEGRAGRTATHGQAESQPKPDGPTP